MSHWIVNIAKDNFSYTFVSLEESLEDTLQRQNQGAEQYVHWYKEREIRKTQEITY
jgi:hypothetical protein